MPAKDFLSVTDLSKAEFEWMLSTASRLKKDPLGDALKGKTVALIFGKPSTRTRVSFSVAVHQLGGMALYLAEHELQIRKSESIEDTARVLSRYVDAIVMRTFLQQDLVDLAAASSVPVINALTDDEHPCQAMADVLTLQERFGRTRGLKITYLGDGNNVASSLAEACALAGIDFCLCVPEGYDLAATRMDRLHALASDQGTRLVVERDPISAAKDASALYTDVWISMGQADDNQKIAALTPYQVNRALLAEARPDAVVMHCLPAHRGEEITDEAMDGPWSVVFDQAENRLHAQKALLLHLLGSESH